MNIEDSLPLTRISVLKAKDKDAAKFQAEDITEESLISNKESSAQILRNTAYSNQDRKFYVEVQGYVSEMFEMPRMSLVQGSKFSGNH